MTFRWDNAYLQKIIVEARFPVNPQVIDKKGQIARNFGPVGLIRPSIDTVYCQNKSFSSELDIRPDRINLRCENLGETDAKFQEFSKKAAGVIKEGLRLIEQDKIQRLGIRFHYLKPARCKDFEKLTRHFFESTVKSGDTFRKGIQEFEDIEDFAGVLVFRASDFSCRFAYGPLQEREFGNFFNFEIGGEIRLVKVFSLYDLDFAKLDVNAEEDILALIIKSREHAGDIIDVFRKIYGGDPDDRSWET